MDGEIRVVDKQIGNPGSDKSSYRKNIECMFS